MSHDGPNLSAGLPQPVLRRMLVAAAVVVLFGGVWWLVQSVRSAGAAAAARPLERPADGYITSTACRSCHESQHASWHASFHRSMTQIPSLETAPELASNEPVVVEGRRYRFEQAGQEFFVEIAPGLESPTARPTRERIVLQTGSHHMHLFWYATPFDRTPALLPISYLLAEQQWVPRRSTFLRPPDMPVSNEIGRWNDGCSNCHSTHPRKRLQPETRVWDTHVAEFGIACEACHGPGEGHAARYAGGAEATADRVVNPARLPHDRRSDVCGQCHSVQWFDFSVVSEAEFLAHGFKFRPGDDLEQDGFRNVVRASPEHADARPLREWIRHEGRVAGTFWPDGTIRVAGREYNAMIETPCYKRGELSCLSCHAMHPEPGRDLAEWRNDQLREGLEGDRSCLQCHSDYADRIPAHTHHATESAGSRCLNCHMPFTTFGLLKTIRSHRIESPSVAVRLETGRSTGCNLCHVDRTLEWTAARLNEWYGQPVPELTAEQRELADSILLLLSGDAAQRAIQAAAYGRPEVQAASGTDWMPAVLLLGLHDPYDAIRWIAAKSLRSLGGREHLEYDFLAPEAERFRTIVRELERIDTDVRLPPRPEVLINPAGRFDFTRATELLQRRDDVPILLSE